jgi:hypothetical protein
MYGDKDFRQRETDRQTLNERKERKINKDGNFRNRDRQRQTEADRGRQRQTAADRNTQRQTNRDRKRQT